MQPHHQTILLLSAIGLLVGMLCFVMQSGFAGGMNPLGLVAFGSLGASLGCLIADPNRESR